MSLRRELGRKAFHLSSVAVPLVVWLLPYRVAAVLLTAAALLALVIDLARLRLRGARYLFLRLTRPILRHHERQRLTGATWMMGAYAIAVLLLPKPIAVLAMLFNGVGDAAAALVGKRWGRHRTHWGKSWEGFAAGFAADLAVGVVVSALSGGLPAAAVLVGALAAAAVEFAPLPLDDNLRVTLGGGAAVLLVVRLLEG